MGPSRGQELSRRFGASAGRFVAAAFVALLLTVVGVGAVSAQGAGASAGASAAAAGGTSENLIQLVAVQMKLDVNDYWTREAFEAKIRQQMDEVAAAIDPELPALVVFPEDVGLMLVAQGMEARLRNVETIQEAIETSIKAHLLPLAWTRLIRRVSWVPALFLHKHEVIAEAYFEVFAAVAAEYEVHLIAGSAALPPYAIEDGVVQWRAGPTEHRVYNTSYYFGPDGKVIGKQDKVHLIELEREAALDLTHGDLASLQVFDSPFGKIGLAICLDGFRDDVIAALLAQGAQILVQPTANPQPWTPTEQAGWLRSSYNKAAVEGLFAYAVNPMIHGPLWDIGFFGQSSIVARDAAAVAETSGDGAADFGDGTGGGAGLGYMDLEPGPGFIRVAASDREEEVLVAVVPHPDVLASR